MAIGASGRPIDAYWSGYYIGRELALLGINMNFAPTVDLYTNRESTLIGPRSFGADPVQAGILGAAFVKGQRETGVIATAKHYPGHGDTDLDSHGVLPKIDASFELIWDRELLPYRLLAKENLPAVMSGHLAFPNTRAGDTPASLSSWFLTDLLRGQIAYKGIIITDDLMMNGAAMFAGSLSRAAKQALLAGNDIIMLSTTPNLGDPVWTYLVSSMRQEPEFRERVRDACRRVLKLKLEYLRGEKKVPYVPDLSRIEAGLADPEGTAFFLSLAARSVTIIDEKKVFPLSAENAGRVLLAGDYAEFFNAGRKAFPNASSYSYDFLNLQTAGELTYYARNADTVILCISDRVSGRTLEQLRRLNKRLIIFSVLSPGHLDELSWADGIVAVYSYAPESFVAGFSAILGRIPGRGRLPFTLNGTRPESSGN
jgi:beta-N-acetylhexosaminidase